MTGAAVVVDVVVGISAVGVVGGSSGASVIGAVFVAGLGAPRRDDAPAPAANTNMALATATPATTSERVVRGVSRFICMVDRVDPSRHRGIAAT
jgi:hypothetical protein